MELVEEDPPVCGGRVTWSYTCPSMNMYCGAQRRIAHLARLRLPALHFAPVPGQLHAG